MKVRELIQALEKCDPDALVFHNADASLRNNNVIVWDNGEPCISTLSPIEIIIRDDNPLNNIIYLSEKIQENR